MARRYTYLNGLHGWAMDECEERLLLALFHSVEHRVRADLHWPEDFLARFYDHGQGVSQYNLDFINSECRRCGVEPFSVRETVAGLYARSPDRSAKARARREFRDAFKALEEQGKRLWIANEREAVERLPLNRFPSRREPVGSALSSTEHGNRLAALEASDIPLPEPNFDRTVRVLARASPNEIALIIRALTPREAALLVKSGRVADPWIMRALLLRSRTEARRHHTIRRQ